MVSLSPELRKALLFILFLIPWFSLYQKHFFLSFNQTGFNGQIITLAEIIFVIFIAIFGRHPSFNKRGFILLAFISLWHALGFLSAYMGEHFYPSAIKQIDYIIHCLFAYSSWVFLSQTKKQEKMAWFLVATLMWVIYNIAAKYYRIPESYDLNWVKVTPFFNNIRHFGYIQMAILPFLFLPLILRKQYGFIITLLLLSIYWASVIWASSRGTFVASCIVSFILIAYFSGFRKNLVRISVLSILLGAIIAFQFPSDSPSMSPFRLIFLDVSLKDSTLNSTSSGRTDMWLTTLKNMWEINPYLGLAADGYRHINPYILKDTIQPHSGPIQLLSEYGLIGALCFMLIVITIINIYRKAPSSKINLISRFSLTGVILASAVDGHFYYNFSLLFISLVLALSFSSVKAKLMNEASQRIIIPITILIIAFALLIPLSKHWASYIEQQFPLTDEIQLTNVMAFPSYYRPNYWISDFSSDSILRSKAIKFGQQNGPDKCSFYQIEYFENIGNQDYSEELKALLKSIDKNCSDYELLKTNNKELISLMKSHK
jgi:hypothetical protein